MVIFQPVTLVFIFFSMRFDTNWGSPTNGTSDCIGGSFFPESPKDVSSHGFQKIVGVYHIMHINTYPFNTYRFIAYPFNTYAVHMHPFNTYPFNCIAAPVMAMWKKHILAYQGRAGLRSLIVICNSGWLRVVLDVSKTQTQTRKHKRKNTITKTQTQKHTNWCCHSHTDFERTPSFGVLWDASFD